VMRQKQLFPVAV